MLRRQNADDRGIGIKDIGMWIIPCDESQKQFIQVVPGKKSIARWHDILAQQCRQVLIHARHPVNGDGKSDLVLGNLGLNAYVHASSSEPARLYVGDFFNTGSLKQILTFYKHGTSYPVVGRDDLVKLMPALRQKYPSFKSFGAATVEQIFPAAELSKATVLEARTFASAVALATGKGFTVKALPAEAQFFPVYGSLARDFDGDGKVDLLLGGNFYGVTPVYGRYDAGYGLFLRGAGDGTFSPVDMARSGVAIDGEVRDLKLVRGPAGRRSVAVARNNDTLLLLRATEAPAAVAAPAATAR